MVIILSRLTTAMAMVYVVRMATVHTIYRLLVHHSLQVALSRKQIVKPLPLAALAVVQVVAQVEILAPITKALLRKRVIALKQHYIT